MAQLAKQDQESFVECRGLRYAIPYETVSTPTYLKDAHVVGKSSLADALGHIYRRHRGTQPIEEATAYWQQEIDAGRVEWRFAKKSRQDLWRWHRVGDNNKKDTEDAAPVQAGMSVRFRQHVHEKVVPAVAEIPLLYETSQYVIIHKPAGLATVDETGGKGINALLTILHHQLHNNNDNNSRTMKLAPAHRLDKPVSGVLMLGKSPSQASKILQCIQSDGQVRKIYIARCQPQNASDKFSTEPFTVTVDLTWDDRHRRSVPCSAEQTAARAKDRQAHQHGHQKRREKKRLRAMPSTAQTDNLQASTEKAWTIHTTQFRRLGEPLPDGTILVECRPYTGYRHQIRAHLAFIGWPIANDAVYGGTIVASEESSKHAYVDDEDKTLHRALGAAVQPWCPKCQWTMSMLSRHDGASSSNPMQDETTNEFSPITVEGGIWLHSYRYVLPSMNIDVIAPLPDWAKEAKTLVSDGSDQSINIKSP